MTLLRLVFLFICLSGLAIGSEDNEIEKPEPSYPMIEYSGQFQIQFNDGRLGTDKAERSAPQSKGIAPYEARDKIFSRRLRPEFTIHFSPDFSVTSVFSVIPDNRQIKLYGLHADYQLDRANHLRLGRFKVPFGWEGYRSSRTTNTAEVSDATSYGHAGQDLGFTIGHRREDLTEIIAGVFVDHLDGGDKSTGKLNFVGRGGFQLSEDLRVGVSSHLGRHRPKDAPNDYPVRRFSSDLQWNNGPFTFETEAVYGDGYNSASKADTRSFGYYLTGIHQLSEPLDLVLSYDRFDPDLDSVNPNFADNAANARDRKVIGLNYNFSRTDRHRLMLNYEFHRTLEGPTIDRSGFRVRYQISW